MIHDYHRRQYDKMYESTRELLDFIEQCAGPMDGQSLLDVACGAGANLFYMLNRWPGVRLTGIDFNGGLLDFARERVPVEERHRLRYEEGDFYAMGNRFASEKMNVTTFVHTLFTKSLDRYPAILASLIGTGSRWVIISSLFTDSNMDVSCLIRDYASGGLDSPENFEYTIADIRGFTRLCESLGVKEIVWKDFDIQIDLEPPSGGGIGTSTVRTVEGRRLQFSGAVYMPWRFAGLRLR